MPSTGNSTWVNDTDPPVSAARLNAMETAHTNAVSKSGDTVAGTLHVTSTVSTGPAAGTTESFFTDSTTKPAAFLGSSYTGNHAVTVRQRATSGTDTAAALNVVSDNPFTSAVLITGVEDGAGAAGRGTVKIRHNGQANGSDSGCAALSIDLRTAGTAAQGIFVTASDGATTGNLITLRNNVRDDFAVSKNGDLSALGNSLGIVAPANHGLTAWSYDPTLAVNTHAMTNGTVYLVKVHIPAGAAVTQIYWHVGTAGTTPTTGQNQVGLYSSAGSRLAVTTVDADISSTGLKATAISSQSLATGATYWVGIVVNATTPPALARTTNIAGVGGLLNVGLAAANYRFAINGTGQTSLPASITPGSASQGISLWAAVGP